MTSKFIVPVLAASLTLASAALALPTPAAAFGMHGGGLGGGFHAGGGFRGGRGLAYGAGLAGAAIGYGYYNNYATDGCYYGMLYNRPEYCNGGWGNGYGY